jgi:hypothetical protein
MNCSICGSRMFTSGCPQCTTRSRPIAYTFQGEVAPNPGLPGLEGWRSAARDLLSKLPRCDFHGCERRATFHGPLLKTLRCSDHASPGHDLVPWAEPAARQEAQLS